MAEDSNVAVDIQSQLSHTDSSGESSIGKMARGNVSSLVNRLVTDPTSPYYLHMVITQECRLFQLSLMITTMRHGIELW